MRQPELPAGSGMLDPGQVSDTRASLLGFLLYGTPQFIERLLQAFGADESVGSAAALAELLPGPHPVLRCLASVDAGGPCCTPSTCVGRHTQMLHGYRPSRVIDMCARAVPVVSCLH